MHVSHYLLLGFFSGPAAEQQAQPAGGTSPRRLPPQLAKPRPAWLYTEPITLTTGTPLEDDEALLLIGAL